MTNTAAGPPLRKQYLDIKRRHPDAILLFRIGDFYEAFDDDARIVARELGIVLTSKPMGRNFRVPLAGVPHHSLERHLATLISRGHRVALCEQLSTEPVKGGPGRGLIERDVVRVVTPGTVVEPGLLESKANNYLAAYSTDGRRAGISYADVTTGEFAATEIDASDALGELRRIAPAEVLIPKSLTVKDDALPCFVTRREDDDFAAQAARAVLLKHFGTRSLAPFGVADSPLAAAAAGAILAYLRDTQSASAVQLTKLVRYHTGNFMLLDQQTLRSLEVLESVGGAPSLLETLDQTRTAMGGRRLRQWLRQPLLDAAEIARRHEHVAWLRDNARARAELLAALELVHDLERLSGRARAGLASAGEVLALGQGIAAIPRVRAVLRQEAARFGSLLASLPECEGVLRVIREALNDEPRSRGETVGVIRAGYSDELDKLRELLKNGRTVLAEMEQRERARTGIKSLRVGFNKVFGHYIEVTRPNLHLVPAGFTRKQTLTQAERFVTLELKEYESLVVNAQERIAELEAGIFRKVCVEIGKRRDEILSAAAALAHLDAAASFAEAADRYDYVRPNVIDAPLLRISQGRHPALERVVDEGRFVANDLSLGGEGSHDIALITGPNMSGKSTFLRQTALIVLMAQAGSFVPARSATVGLCDRVFTRIGLYDRIGSGESTFMTEMVETAHILNQATPRSLILLDELGRGTSTYDGLAVARAVLEHLHNHPNLRARTLFATHYHELTALADVLPRVENLHVEIAEEDGELVFLHRVSPGSAERSYGVYAAKLAGLPRPVVRRAEELLAEYESPARGVEVRVAGDVPARPSASAPLDAERQSRLIRALLDSDVNNLSPVEALMKLFELRRIAEEGGAEGGTVRAAKRA
ncbi:MAG TPA: DNA mismatch repair protein MutS [Pyrinomonadaceae bacterium]|nr:DNA mismatch repair protein MutS [Pyrinomonadaceae bacterium]